MNYFSLIACCIPNIYLPIPKIGGKMTDDYLWQKNFYNMNFRSNFQYCPKRF